MKQFVKASLLEAQQALMALCENDRAQSALARAARAMSQSLQNGGRIFSCGNGGSLCDAMHFAEEMTGRYRKNRPAYSAIAIADPSHIACVGNDFGYEYVFSRYIEAHGRAGDILLAITTSGTSRNVCRAAEVAKKKGMVVVALTGRDGVRLTDEIADIAIVTPAGHWADRVQELHIKCIHILIELIERKLAPENYGVEES